MGNVSDTVFLYKFRPIRFPFRHTHFASYAGDKSRNPYSPCKVSAIFAIFLQILEHRNEFLLNFPISNFRNICSAVFEFLHVDARRCMVKLTEAFSQPLRQADIYTSGKTMHRGRLK